MFALATAILFPGIENATPVHVVTSQVTVMVPTEASHEIYAVRFPRSAYDYSVVWKSAHADILLERGRETPLDGIALPPGARPGDRMVLRATFPYEQTGTLAPMRELHAKQRLDTTILALFAGFFLAMALVNAMAWFVLRSSSSGWIGALAATMVGILVYSIGWLRPFDGAAAPYEQIEHIIFVGSNLGCVTAFSLALLDALRADRTLARIAIGLYWLNLALLICEDMLGSAWHFYAIDQAAEDTLLLVLAALGVRAMQHGFRTLSGFYLAAFIGPFAGIPLNDLVENSVIAPYWVSYAFEVGAAWQLSFFAYAVALRNRELRVERDRFNRLAHLDQLTGVSNRRTFDEYLSERWRLAAQGGGTVALVLLDVDRFKSINDTRGHKYGDEVLRAVAKACAAVPLRDGDCFARYGGEEFAAILVGTDLDGAVAVAERMRAAVEATSLATISAGVAAAAPARNGESSSLVESADRSLYRAKEAGRNRVVAER